MYRPPEDIHELRQKCLPWLIAATILLIACICSGVFYLLMYHRHEFIGLYSTESAPVRTQIPVPKMTELPTSTTAPLQLSRDAYDRDRYDVPLSEESSEEYLEFNKEPTVAPTTIVLIEERTMSTVAVTTTPAKTTSPSPATSTTAHPATTTPSRISIISTTEVPNSSSYLTTTSKSPTTPPIIFYTPPSRLATTSTTPVTTAEVPSTTGVPVVASPETKTNETEPSEEPLSYSKAAVTSNEEICSEIGLRILTSGGNAMEVAIATEFCVAAVNPHLTGLAASTIIMVHQSSLNKTTVLNAQAVAPRSATANTYMINRDLAKRGYSSIAVPGSLAGLSTAFRRFGSGKMMWQDLLLPSIELLEKGFPVSSSLHEEIQNHSKEWATEKSMSSHYNASISPGEIVTNRALAETLRRLATSREPAQLFYRGDIANQIVQEMKSRGGLISKLDLVNYSVKVEEATEVELTDGRTMIGPYPPSEFAALAYVVGSITDKYGFNFTTSNSSSFNEYLTKLLKDAEYLSGELMDPHFHIDSKELAQNLTRREFRDEFRSEKDNQETTIKRDNIGSHINVMDEDGMLVTITSTLNAPFGSQRRSEKLGFVWNNLMDAFATDDSDEEGDIVEGNKRARTGMIPVIVVDREKELYSLIGGTGTNIMEDVARELISDEHSEISSKIQLLKKDHNKIRAHCGKTNRCSKVH